MCSPSINTCITFIAARELPVPPCDSDILNPAITLYLIKLHLWNWSAMYADPAGKFVEPVSYVSGTGAHIDGRVTIYCPRKPLYFKKANFVTKSALYNVICCKECSLSG